MRVLNELVAAFDKFTPESLAKALDRDGTGLSPQMASLIKAEGEAITLYRSMARTMAQARQAFDPQQIDADDLQTDLYAGLQFSSLYRDPEKSTSFFSTSRPFVALDLRQTLRWPEQGQWVEFFGTLSFQSSSKETSDAVAVITTSGNFRGEIGAWWMRSLTEGLSWGFIGSLGLVGYSTFQHSRCCAGWVLAEAVNVSTRCIHYSGH